MTTFLRLLAETDKAAALQTACARVRQFNSVASGQWSVDGKHDPRVFEVSPKSFDAVPGKPFAYWVSDAVRETFRRLPAFGESALATSGTGTLDDFRFLHTWWETISHTTFTSNQKWFPYAKGGAFAPMYFDHYLSINWNNDGDEMKAWIVVRYGGGHWARNIRSTEHYLRPGLTWPRRTQGGLSLRTMPSGCIFADKGPTAFVANDNPDELLALLALTNSRAFGLLVSLLMAFGSYEVGVIQKTPVPPLSTHLGQLSTLARRAWSLKRTLDTVNETSHAFLLPLALRQEVGRNKPAPAGVSGNATGQVPETVVARPYSGLQADITRPDPNPNAVELVPPPNGGKSEAKGALGGGLSESSVGAGSEPAPTDTCPHPNPPPLGEGASRLNSTPLAFDPPTIEAELTRIQAEIDDIAFDLYGFSEADREMAMSGQSSLADENESLEADEDDEEDATGNSPLTTNHSPLLSWAVGVAFGRFDWRLATGERAMPPEPEPFDPLPAKSPGMLPDDAEPFHKHVGILVDDQGHPHDLAHLVEEVLARVDVAVPEDTRHWLQRDFFPFHLQRYSKSRRKAPIYWPLATATGSYALWIYYPKLNHQTLYTAINDFVEPKLKQVVDDVATLRNKAAARSRDDEKQFEVLQAFELELIELRDTLLKLAPSYKPNHDDGVQITAAPLWSLFRHKPWQKVLKETWAKLEKGDYDWAHLAMNYWPDRVREKCKTDKSLAIAHGLEYLYIEPETQAKKGRGRKAKED